jgi:hypothetical protein
MTPETPALSVRTAGAIPAGADPEERRGGLSCWTVGGPFVARWKPALARSVDVVWKVRVPAAIPSGNVRRCVGRRAQEAAIRHDVCFMVQLRTFLGNKASISMSGI